MSGTLRKVFAAVCTGGPEKVAERGYKDMIKKKLSLFAAILLSCVLFCSCTAEDVLPILEELLTETDEPSYVDVPSDEEEGEEWEEEPEVVIPEEIDPEEVIPEEKNDVEVVPGKEEKAEKDEKNKDSEKEPAEKPEIILPSEDDKPEEKESKDSKDPKETEKPSEDKPKTEPDNKKPSENSKEEPDTKPESGKKPEEHTTSPPAEPTIDVNGSYTKKEDVALYLHLYRKLPPNFISKAEAEADGWKGGGLSKGRCIGGSYFGNYEGKLPKGNGIEYHECDIDTMNKKSRGAKRLVWSNKGAIYYTDDHYETFTLLYERWA